MAQVRRNDTEVGDFGRNARSFAMDLSYRNRSDSTAVTYAKAIDQFVAYLSATGGPVNVADVTTDHIRGWLSQLRADGKAPATCAQRYRSLQAFYVYLVKEGRVTVSPFATLSPPAVPAQFPPTLDDDALKRLLKVTSGTSFVDRRDHAILTLFIESGMRRGELSGLRLDDLDLDRRTAYVTGKGDRDRLVPFGKVAARTLDRYLYARDRYLREHPNADDEWLWLGQKGRFTETGIEQMVKRRAREAGLVDPDGRVRVHPHLFRHTAAHRYLDDDMSEGDVMANMGWKSRQMVDRYGASGKAERARAHQSRHSIMDRLNGSR